MRSRLAGFAALAFFVPAVALAFPFGGQINQIIFCYNNAIYTNLGPPRGGPFIWTPSTRTYRFGPPLRTGQWLLGLAAPPYYCIVSKQPIIVWSGILMTMEGSSGAPAPKYTPGTKQWCAEPQRSTPTQSQPWAYPQFNLSSQYNAAERTAREDFSSCVNQGGSTYDCDICQNKANELQRENISRFSPESSTSTPGQYDWRPYCKTPVGQRGFTPTVDPCLRLTQDMTCDAVRAEGYLGITRCGT